MNASNYVIFLGRKNMSFKTTAQLAALLLSTALFTACGNGDAETSTNDPSATTSTFDLGRRIEKLASDEFQGRAPSTAGGQAASQYIADEMSKAGLAPAGENGTYFQAVELTAMTVLPSSSMTITAGEETLINADQNTNSVFWTKRLDSSVSVSDAELVFVGYGVNAPEYGWNDYEGLDVKGKTVVMLVNDPGFATKDANLFNGNAMTYYGRWTYKYEEAARQGAAAVLVIHETEPASYPWEVVSGSWTGEQYDLVRPDGGASRSALEGWLHIDAAQNLFDKAGLNMRQLMTAAAQKGFKPVPMSGLSLDATINQSVKTTQSRNVAGVIKGSVRPDEYVLYMAHWDHLGMSEAVEGDDKIFNGAVDNASGTSVILEIGETMVDRGTPERSVIFVGNLVITKFGVFFFEILAISHAIDDMIIARIGIEHWHAEFGEANMIRTIKIPCLRLGIWNDIHAALIELFLQ